MSSNLPRTVIQFHEAIRAAVAAALAEAGLEASFDLAPTPNPELGDVGLACFPFAKAARKAPQAIAADLAARLQGHPLLEKVGVEGAYVNLGFNTAALAAVVLGNALRDGDNWAAGAPLPEKWILEYSSPNTNKPLHLGHIRNNLLGLALSRLLRYAGADLRTVNLINDRGIHICKTMLAWQRWGEGATPQSAGVKGDHFVGSLYVRFDREFKAEFEAWKAAGPGRAEVSSEAYFNGPESSLGGATRELLLRWEASDPQVLELWRRMNGWVLAGFEKTYQRMGCTFDLIQYESQTYLLGRDLVLDGLARGIFHRREDGAICLDLAKAGLEGEKVLLRPDGTSVYITQDIGTAMQRLTTLGADRLAYVVGDEQLYHFQVLFAVLELLRPGTADRCRHVAYGMIRLPEGRMKSREGTVVDADDLMDELYGLALEEVKGRAGKAHYDNVTDADAAHRAELIAQAALKYHMFRFTPKKSFEYNPKESIDFNGQTGPYCLYTYARTRSLLRKAWEGQGGGRSTVPFSPAAAARLASPLERGVLMLLQSYPRLAAESAAALDPSRVAEFAYVLCRSFNLMFADREGHPITTCEDADLKHARLMLVDAVGITLRSALGILGMEMLEEM
jgi:arginyl-tRNA synthetase